MSDSLKTPSVWRIQAYCPDAAAAEIERERMADDRQLALTGLRQVRTARLALSFGLGIAAFTTGISGAAVLFGASYAVLWAMLGSTALGSGVVALLWLQEAQTRLQAVLRVRSGETRHA